jgi:hypothetical protein
MSGFIGAIEGVVGDIAGAAGGGDFLGELMQALEGTMAQSSSNASTSSNSGDPAASSNSGGSSTGSEIAQIAGDVLPIVAAFL